MCGIVCLGVSVTVCLIKRKESGDKAPVIDSGSFFNHLYDVCTYPA